jgi:hypothetical protein
MKKKNTTVGTVQNPRQQKKIDTPSTQIHDRSLQ